jgi:hypothetical protein
VELTAYHHARPAEILKATFRTDATGRSTRRVVMRREGFYQINLTATAAGQRFVTSLTPFVSTAARGPS